MRFDPEQHHRRSIRLKEYDYAQNGAYFVTICTQDRSNIFGEVEDCVIQANDAGQMVSTVWDELPDFYPGVSIDAFTLMPNHIHGIVLLVGAARRGRSGSGSSHNIGENDDARLGTLDVSSPGSAHGIRSNGDVEPNDDGQRGTRGVESITSDVRAVEPGRPRGAAPTRVGLSLADVVHRFKTLTTKRYADGVKQAGWMPFPGRLWHRDYFEHVIRDEVSLNRIRRYIEENPMRWVEDNENPLRVSV